VSTRAERRFEDERHQGEKFAALELESVWGWAGPAGRVRAERRARFLTEAAGLRSEVRCLELGCGTGVFTERLVATGCELVAVDVSEASVERCRERVGDRAEVVVGNVESGAGLEGRAFDAIVGVSVLHHVDLRACLERTFAHLTTGGRFAFCEPNMANPQVWAERNIAFVQRLRHVLPHETAFRPKQLRRSFDDAGLEVEICEPFEFLHAATPEPLIGLTMRVERLLEATPAREIAGSIRVAGRKP
jgi:SAM-dependent methyltransferase